MRVAGSEGRESRLDPRFASTLEVAHVSEPGLLQHGQGDVGAPAHLGLLAHDVLSRAQAQGWGQEGFPIAARILEAVAGAELRAPVGDVAGYQTEDPRRGRT